MRIDKKGKMHTLEEDIVETWKGHGLKVVEERVSGDTWEIKAIRIKSKEEKII